MRYLLDTNAVIAASNDHTGIVAKRLQSYREDDVVVSAVVMHELYFGAYRSRRVEQNVAKIEAMRFRVIDLNEGDVRCAAQLRAVLAQRGTPIGPYDLLIAGQCLARGLTVVTANTREFVRAEGLMVEDWS